MVKKPRRLIKPLLYFHLFVCLVWLSLFHTNEIHPWMSHVVILSILAIQFTWSLTVGLIVGPDKARRSLLWWSLLTVFMPLSVIHWIVLAVAFSQGILIGLIYLLAFVLILGCETFCGVLMGVKLHSQDSPKAA